MRRLLTTLALGSAIAGPLAAQRAERVVIPGGAGPNKLSFDAGVLARVQPFRVTEVPASEGRVAVAGGGAGDLRLFDKANREVPYLLITPRVEAQWRAARLLPIAPTKFTSGFEADFETALPVDRVRIAGLPAPFLKRVQVEGSGDRAHWTLLVPDGTLFDLPNDGLELTGLDLPAGAYRYLRLTWDDRASRRMPLPRQVEVRVASATRGPAPLRTTVSVERRPSEPGKSRFRIRLPGAHLPIVAIELTVGGGNVLRTARITEGRLEGSTVVPTELGSATLRRSVRDGLAAAELRIPIAPPSESQLELAVDDGNNPPLDVTGATAIFATLPFIFFESSGDTLTARFGDDRLAAPRYDLEAERDRVPSLALASAHWGVSREVPVAAGGAAAAMPTAGAAIDPQQFRYARSIPLGTAGLATLPLDVAALAHGSLADVRIATADGYQVPFLVERLAEPLAVKLPPPERVTTGRDPSTRSRYRIRLPYAGLPASRLVVQTDSRVFDREVELQMTPSAADDPRARSGHVTIAAATWRNTDPELPAAALSMDLPALRVGELSLVIDEGDNAPLPLREATLLLPAYRLRFFRDASTPLTLLYGRSDVSAPRYDLALLAPRLLGAPAQDVAASAERETSNVTGVTPTIVFWCALALAVLALVVLIARLLRPDNGAPTTPAAAPPSTTTGASPATGE
jgi:hypothetical protein